MVCYIALLIVCLRLPVTCFTPSVHDVEHAVLHALCLCVSIVCCANTCMCTVHVTSYLFFSAEIRILPSWNSVNVHKIFHRASAPALQTGCRNVPTVEHGIRSSRVAGETWWKSSSYARLGRHRVVWTRDTQYAIYASSDLQTQNIFTYAILFFALFAAHRSRKHGGVDTKVILSSQFGV